MDFTYPKTEKLKSRTVINSLFSDGKTIGKYPLRLVYIENDAESADKIKFSVSVSKKHFKKAVDRNYFKRVLRECYRLNKHLILETTNRKFSIMFFYQTKERLTYQEINEKTIQLFTKFIEQLNS